MDGSYEDFPIGEQHTERWAIILITDPRDNSGDLLWDCVLSKTPAETGQYIHAELLAEAYGWKVYLLERELWDAARESAEIRYGKLYSKEQVHRDLWVRMRKRGEVLKLRRKKKKGNGK